jgi:hypothetical protein
MKSFILRWLTTTATNTPVSKTPSDTETFQLKLPSVRNDALMKLSDHQHHFLSDVVKLLIFSHGKGFKITGGELLRTPEQQEIYIREGKSKTRRSKHLKKCAIDLNFFKPRKTGGFTLTYSKAALQEIGDYWESLSPENRWGGNFKTFLDTPHFERNV